MPPHRSEDATALPSPIAEGQYRPERKALQWILERTFFPLLTTPVSAAPAGDFLDASFVAFIHIPFDADVFSYAGVYGDPADLLADLSSPYELSEVGGGLRLNRKLADRPIARRVFAIEALMKQLVWSRWSDGARWGPVIPGKSRSGASFRELRPSLQLVWTHYRTLLRESLLTESVRSALRQEQSALAPERTLTDSIDELVAFNAVAERRRLRIAYPDFSPWVEAELLERARDPVDALGNLTVQQALALARKASSTRRCDQVFTD
jgi:hypothetical protein